MMHIFLLGYMGSGKTTYGELLAAQLGLPFVDLDNLIEKGEGKSVFQIFAEQGEQGFRLLEQKYLHDLSKFPQGIVATGGGTPCFFDNLLMMNELGATIYLKASAELLCERLSNQLHGRPILAHLNGNELLSFIRESLAVREEFYGQAHIVIEQTAKTSKTEVLDLIVGQIEAFK